MKTTSARAMVAIVCGMVMWLPVASATVSGTVKTAGGDPVSGAIVVITSEQDAQASVSDTTDAQGRYAITLPTVGVAESTPRAFSLGQNYPNPFNPSTLIPFSLDVSGHVVLTVYNVLGQRVRTLVDDYQGEGMYAVPWDGIDDAGSSVSAGIYLYQIRFGGQIMTKKMLLIDGGSGSRQMTGSQGGGLSLKSAAVAKPGAITFQVEVFRDTIEPVVEPLTQSGVTLLDGGVYDVVVGFITYVPGDGGDPAVTPPQTTDPAILTGILNSILDSAALSKPAVSLLELPDPPVLPPVTIDTAGKLLVIGGSSSPVLDGLAQELDTVTIESLLAFGFNADSLRAKVADAAGIALNTDNLTLETRTLAEPLVGYALSVGTPVVFENPGVREEYLSQIPSAGALSGVQAVAAMLGIGIGAHLSVVLPDELDPSGDSHKIITLGVDHVSELLDVAEDAPEVDPDSVSAGKRVAGAAKATGREAVQEGRLNRVVKDGYKPDDMVNSGPVQYRSYRIEPWEDTTWNPDGDLAQTFSNNVDFFVQLFSNSAGTEKWLRIFTPASGGFSCDRPDVRERLDKGYYQSSAYVSIRAIEDNSLDLATCEWLDIIETAPSASPATHISRVGSQPDELELQRSLTEFSLAGRNEAGDATFNFDREVEFNLWDTAISHSGGWYGQKVSWTFKPGWVYDPRCYEEGKAVFHNEYENPSERPVDSGRGVLKALKLETRDDIYGKISGEQDRIYLPTDIAQSGWPVHVQALFKNDGSNLNGRQRFQFLTTQYATRSWSSWGEVHHRIREMEKWRTFVVDFSVVGAAD